jgi:hypothetical protein
VNGQKTWEERQKLIDQRNSYLQVIMENRCAPIPARKREVYLDESYIHQHHHQKYSWQDPKKSAGFRVATRGPRICFIAAIMGPNPRKRTHTGGDKAGLVPNSFLQFVSNKSGSKGDYHKNFNAKNFLEWFKQLLENLPKEPSCLIMLDKCQISQNAACGYAVAIWEKSRH